MLLFFFLFLPEKCRFIMKDAVLPYQNHGLVVLGKIAPILMYQVERIVYSSFFFLLFIFIFLFNSITFNFRSERMIHEFWLTFPENFRVI